MRSTLLAAALAAAFVAPASATVLYSNDFDGNETVAPGVAVSALTNGSLEAAVTNGNWAGSYFANRNGSSPATLSQLTLSNLLPHTQVSVNFMLGFLESWDSFDGGCCAPDNLDFFVDGAKVATLTTNNALGSVQEYGGGTVVVYQGQINGNGIYSDTLVDMSTAGFLTFAHTGTTLTLGIQAGGAGWQGFGDEAWGIDALSVSYNGTAPIPEPSTWALMAMGVGIVGAALRRRKADG